MEEFIVAFVIFGIGILYEYMKERKNKQMERENTKTQMRQAQRRVAADTSYHTEEIPPEIRHTTVNPAVPKPGNIGNSYTPIAIEEAEDFLAEDQEMDEPEAIELFQGENAMPPSPAQVSGKKPEIKAEVTGSEERKKPSTLREDEIKDSENHYARWRQAIIDTEILQRKW